MNKQHFNPRSILFLFLIIFSCLAFYSCKKTDVVIKDMDPIERFFKIPDNADPTIVRIIQDLKQKNKEQPFVEQFIAAEGYPLWEYAKIKNHKNRLSSLAKDNEGDTIVDIPIVPDSAKFVKDILSTKLNTEVLYKLFKGDEYGSYGFDKDPNRETPNADDVVGRIMGFEKSIWGVQFFKVSDNKLFDYWTQGIEKPEAFYISVNTRYETIVLEGVCPLTQVPGGQLTPCPPGVDHCWELQTEACDIHLIAYVEDEGGGGGGWVTTPSYGGGGADPSSPAGGNTPECSRTWVRLAENPETGTLENPCTGTPVVPFLNPETLYYGMGVKPLKEYSLDNRCTGLQEMWNDYPHNEVVGFVTTDGKLIVTSVVNIAGGGFKGLYKYANPATGLDEYYYVYPVSDGLPSLEYPGMLIRGENYFIPVVASVHTHTPCREDGTNGVSHNVGDDDKDLANKHPLLKNWVIGCNAIAQFNKNNDNFFNIHAGDISVTCTFIP